MKIFKPAIKLVLEDGEELEINKNSFVLINYNNLEDNEDNNIHADIYSNSNGIKDLITGSSVLLQYGNIFRIMAEKSMNFEEAKEEHIKYIKSRFGHSGDML